MDLMTTGYGSLLTYQPDRPEVRRQRRLDQVRVGEREVAFHSPRGAPGVAHDEPLIRVVVTDRHHRVPAHRPLTPPRHRGVAGARDRRALEALVDGEPENERIARREASLHLIDVLHEALVRHRAVERGVRVSPR